MSAMDSPKPLQGFMVVELAHWLAGPVAGGLLADWGAEVIKVEPPGGDPMRHIWHRMGLNPKSPNAAFITANRGKRSVELEVGSAEGQGALDALLRQADVLVTNLRPGALERLDLSPDAVRERYPRLVYCSLTGYGWDGPDRDRAGYDVAAFFGRSGVSHQLTADGGAPVAPLAGVGDTFTGLAAAAGILAALLERNRTGIGRFVEASLLRTGMWSVSGDLGTQAMGGTSRAPAPRDASRTPLFNSYRSSDGRWFFLVCADAGRHFKQLAQAIERPDLLTDDRFTTAEGMSKNRRELIALLDEAFATRTLPEWAARFAHHDIWWAPVQTAADLVDDPQALATGAWVTVVGDDGVPRPCVDAPVRFDRTNRGAVSPAPGTGQHTAEVLGRLGLDH